MGAKKKNIYITCSSYLIYFEYVKSAYCDSGQETFRDVRHHDSHKEDHSSEEGVADNHSNDKEGTPKEDSQPSDDVHKVLNLYGNGGLLITHSGSQAGNAANDGSVTGVDDYSCGYTYETMQRNLVSK